MADREQKPGSAKLEVDQEILYNTSECPSDFACLSDPSVMCPTEGIVKQNLFVKKSYKSCPYKVYFCGSTACGCPTRKAIYEKYKQ
jgi:hypothetical protein